MLGYYARVNTPAKLSANFPLAILTLCLASVSGSCVVQEASSVEQETKRIGHAKSGIVFPESLGAFQRGALHKFDEKGLDISAIYTRFHLRDQLNAQIYVYPASTVRSLGSDEDEIRAMRKVLLEKSFEGVKQSIFENQPEAELVMEDSSVVILQGKERDAITANLIYTDMVGFMKIQFFTSASLFALDQWLILVRLTAPDDSVGRSLEEVGGLYQEFMKANGGQLSPKGNGNAPAVE